jgi:hypothetical protein
MTPLGQAAVALGAKGLRVFPCWRNKKPAIDDFPNAASTDEATIRKWWGEQGQWSIGIATGEGSGLWVLDIDGDQGEQTLRWLEAKNGPLPRTVISVTGDKGRHFYFKHPNDITVHNAQERDEIPSIHVRGWNGYVIAPPSRHPNGNLYRWAEESAAGFAPAPGWLIKLVTERTAPKSDDGSAVAPTLPEAWRALIDADHEGSHRSSAVARLYGHFARRNIDAVLALHFAFMFDEMRNKPPLGRPEVRRICDDIANREADRRENR